MQPHLQIREQDAFGQETIVAISTPQGRGGIGIVRLSGRQALAIAQVLVRTRGPIEHARARLAEIADPETAERLDECVVTYFAGPRSYTGENLVEIAAHGSPVILDLLVRLGLKAGARLARPGEFTERAFLAGRLDLTQAEAVRDLIEAQTLFQARVAAEQMGGGLARRVSPAKQSLVELIALLEAGIDFAEDDVEVTPEAEILARLEPLEAALKKLAASFEQGRIIREGVRLAIVGRPNVGKSSLFNRLLERERAIVTAMPGTTRDLVSERLSLAGIPVELVDTAGLRDAHDEAEAIGIQKTRETMAEADLVLLVLDASASVTAEDQAMIAAMEGRRGLIVWNKCDLDVALTGQDVELQEPQLFAPTARTSAVTGEGVADMRETLATMVKNPASQSESGLLTNLRQFEAVREAVLALEAARASVEGRVPHEMLLLDLYGALRQLDALTGETTSDDILNRIFSTFCIGK